MQHFSNYSLRFFNTFGLDVKAKDLWIVEQQTDIAWLKQEGIFAEKHYILGGGSNILLTQDFDGHVIVINIKGKEIISQENNWAIIYFGAGEIWHESVLWAIENNFGGLENLSLIPGTVGAAPMQNIGAYGVEIKDVFYQLKAYNKNTGEIATFKTEDCAFGYRESVFKTHLKDQYIILSVEFKLSTKNHVLHTQYGAIQEVLQEKGIAKPTINNISEAVIEIRQSKLPNPKEIGNSGSFFKNPVVEKDFAQMLLERFPNMPAYPAPDEKIKLAAGWLIEQCGWKGKRVGETGSHAKQALVLVNYGNAKGQEIWQLALDIQKSVFEKFGVVIEPEVNVV